MSRWRHAFAGGLLRSFKGEANHIASKFGKVVDVEVYDNNSHLSPLQAKVLKECIHLVRTSADHGIESAEERLALGKGSKGNISFFTECAPEGIRLTLNDDGRGVDWERMRDKARTMGLPAESDADLQAAFFADDGLSTRDEVTLSGRGVGTGAVAAAVTRGAVSRSRKAPPMVGGGTICSSE
ncbi:MAG: hypothetical protein GY822_15125 [Deltaproteobacteria bacterium]|nr:hypothetical protein [Deltaproteobacteria bacterium]